MKNIFWKNWVISLLILLPAVLCPAADVNFPYVGPDGEKIWGLGSLRNIYFVEPKWILTRNTMALFVWDRITGNLSSMNYDVGKPYFTQAGSIYYYLENNTVVKGTLNLEGTWQKTVYDKEKYGKELYVPANGSVLLTVDDKNYFRLWDAATMTEKVKLNLQRNAASSYVNSITNNGTYFLHVKNTPDSNGQLTGYLRIVSLLTGDVIYEETNSGFYGDTIIVSPDEKLFFL